MQNKVLRTNTFMLEASKQFTNISIIRCANFLIFVRVVNAPKLCRALAWSSTAEWFSHMLATRISVLLKSGESIEMAYKYAMMKMRRDLVANNYTPDEIRQIQFNFICLKLISNKAFVVKAGDDYMMLSLGDTDIQYDDFQSLTVDSKLPNPLLMNNLKSISVCSKPFAEYCVADMLSRSNTCTLHNLTDGKLRNILNNPNTLDADVAYISSRVS